jgi:hypothetical protein
LPGELRDHIVVQDGHWLWIGSRSNGYGKLYWPPRGWQYAHRVVYRAAGGRIATGKHLHHTCGVRSCVNPEHLQVLTNRAHGRITNPGKTHCKHGHEFTPDNTYWARGFGNRPYRHCRECQRRRNRERAARQK